MHLVYCDAGHYKQIRTASLHVSQPDHGNIIQVREDSLTILTIFGSAMLSFQVQMDGSIHACMDAAMHNMVSLNVGRPPRSRP
jgi:hypothetical protein